jgi:two-component SAPR family response regulator
MIDLTGSEEEEVLQRPKIESLWDNSDSNKITSMIHLIVFSLIL